MSRQNANASLMKLPILKHFNEGEISKQVDKFRKGEKGLFWFFKLAVLGATLYFSWVYVLPPVFQAIGQVMAIASTIGCIVLLAILTPTILKAMRRFTRFCHKAVIKHDPFGELREQQGKMLQNKEKFQRAKGKIVQLKSDMEIDADASEQEAKALQKRILSNKKKAEEYKTRMDEMVATGGKAAKGTDEYVDLDSKFRKVVADSERIMYKYDQSKDFVQKYATRANILKKFGQKLTRVETTMDIKIADFDATIEILEKDYTFAQKSREATESAKSAMLFSKDWELDYALDVVTTTIAEDIAITAGNLNDIDTLTSNYAVDSDELYDSLDTLADEIRTGKDIVPDASDYSNPEYILTQDDKNKSGGFGNIFDN